MAFWITLKKDEVRRGFSAPTAQEALAVLEAKTLEGYEQVRIIHPGGFEVSAYALQLLIDQEAIDAEAVNSSAVLRASA